MKVFFPIESNLAQKVWNSFERELDHKLRALPDLAREEVKLELLSHLYDSASADSAVLEEERFINAIDRLGAPGDYLEPLVEEIFLAQGTSKGHPSAVLRSLLAITRKGIWHLALTALFGFGYVVAIIVFIMAVMHVGDPDVGVWLSPNGSVSFSFEFQPNATQWMPESFSAMGIAASVALYWLLSQMLGRLIGKPSRDK